jgi:hypothetical protein
MVHERTEAYAGVDVSKERLEVCVRRGREAKEGQFSEVRLREIPHTPLRWGLHLLHEPRGQGTARLYNAVAGATRALP